MNQEQIRNIVEAALMIAGRPLSLDDLLSLFGDEARPDRGSVREVVQDLAADYEGRGIELLEVASGYRIQARPALTDFLSRLWQERPPRYSRALMETLALIAYRQPITRGEIEDVRGVSVSTNIIRTLLDRNWVRVVGHRDVPGKPAMYGTTREFLDYFGLKKLDELPSLAELTDIDSINVELDLGDPELGPAVAANEEVGEETPAGGERDPLAGVEPDESGDRAAAVAEPDDSEDAPQDEGETAERPGHVVQLPRG